MKENYHIFKNGELKREDNTLVFIESTEQDKTHLPIERIEAIYTHGQITFNTRLYTFLNKNRIEIHMFGWNGQYSGSYIPEEGQKSGKAVVKQASAYNDSSHRQKLASEFVNKSIENMRTQLLYHNRKSNLDLSHEISELKNIKTQTSSTSNIPELLGVEATARKTYYNLYRKTISNTDFEFTHREYNPPPNEINALISFGNSMVYTACTSGIRATTLDPSISFLHEPGERRYSLSLDIADLFKPLLADRIILKLINRNQISEGKFRYEDGVCLLNEIGRKTYLKEYESMLEETVKHPQVKRNVSYYHLLRLESYALKKHLLMGEEYNAFKQWW